jgi:hypothetical protein
MLILAAGKLCRMARTAGVVITASPIQLVDRISRRLILFFALEFTV